MNKAGHHFTLYSPNQNIAQTKYLGLLISMIKHYVLISFFSKYVSLTFFISAILWMENQ